MKNIAIAVTALLLSCSTFVNPSALASGSPDLNVIGPDAKTGEMTVDIQGVPAQQIYENLTGANEIRGTFHLMTQYGYANTVLRYGSTVVCSALIYQNSGTYWPSNEPGNSSQEPSVECTLVLNKAGNAVSPQI